MDADETTEAARRPSASIHAYVGRELTMARVEDGYELRHEEAVLARLGEHRHEPLVRCTTRDGEWLFTRTRGARIEVTEPRDGAPAIARYRSGTLPGGAIELPGGERLRLRARLLGDTWRVRRGLHEPIAEFREPWRPWRVRLSPGARDLHELPLLTMLAFDAVVVELDMPAGSAPSGVGGF